MFSSRSIVLAVLIIVAPLALSSLAASSPTFQAGSPEAKLRDHLQKLDQRLQRRLDLTLSRAAAGEMPAEGFEREVAALRRHLESLETQARHGDYGDPAPWLERLRALDRLAENLGRAARLEPAAAAARLAKHQQSQPPAARPKTTMPPSNDTCETALPLPGSVVTGTTLGATADGSASCGFSELSPDVWYRFTPPVDGSFFFSTAGSGFDTVLSVHDGCPAAAGSELACEDNGVGLQSSLGLFVEGGEDYFIRVSGFAGAAGDYRLSVGAGGIVTGTVRDAVSGQPLPFVDVELIPLDSFGFNTIQTDSTGTYRLDGLAPGRYTAIARAQGNFVSQVLGGGNCSPEGCDPSLGTPIEVDASGVRSGIDFALDRGGRITGTVRDATTGEPSEFARVSLWRHQAPLSRVAEVSTNTAGEYVFEGLPAGSFVVTAEQSGYGGELYPELPCIDPFFGSCDLSAGAPIAIALGETRSGIDFTLDRGGMIAGQVLDAVSGEPIDFAEVEIFDQEGSSVAFTSTNSTGFYAAGGLLPGMYFAGARVFFGAHYAEIYEDHPCPDDFLGSEGCDPITGDPIAVQVATTTPGIDFTLDRKGVISGRVIDATTGQPIAGASIEVLFTGGGFEESGSTDATGHYRIEDLETSQYLVIAQAPGYLSEVYDDIACNETSFGGFDCSSVGGDPIEVGRGAEVAGIDFALRLLGAIEGRVTDAGSRQPIVDAQVEIYQPNGNVAHRTFTDEQGRYRVGGLSGHGYRAIALAEEFQPELWNGIPCPDFDCEIATGGNIQVTIGQTTSGVDFSLSRLGSLSGRVTDIANGAPLPGIAVWRLSPAGTFLSFASTDATGRYLFTGVETGSYRIWASAGEPYLAELYEDVPCFNPRSSLCDLAASELLEVRLGQTTGGIDLALGLGATITGTVTRETEGQPLFDEPISIWDATGRILQEVFTDSNGRYTLGGLPGGRYFATTSDFSEFIPELYRDLLCPDDNCPATSGTPIDLAPGATAAGIDFSLQRYGTITGRVTDARTGGALASVLVRLWDAQGNFVGGGFSNSAGDYEASVPGTGVFYVAVSDGGAYLGELYPGLPCPRDACDPTTGQPISVALDATVTGIDFTLDLGAAIAGKVSDAVRRRPITFANVDLWNVAGERIATTFVDSFGRYVFLGLQPGTYFVSTQSFGFFRDEVWNEVICTDVCIPTAGDPIVIELLGAVATGVDFDLVPLFGEGCGFDEPLLCLNNQRFKVTAHWRNFAGDADQAEGQPLTDDSGYFWFFDPDNIEVVAKVIDACNTAQPRFWVFAAGLTNVEVELEVEDTLTGDVKTYQNALGQPFQPILDTDAFATCGTELAPAPRLARKPAIEKGLGDCQSDVLGLCLNQGRFRVEAFFETFQGTTGQGQAVELTADSGYFWFFDDANVEVVVKVLNACGDVDPRFWVFAAGLTNVEVLLRVTDTESGEVREYRNPLATPFRPILDTEAFATCP